MIRICRLFLLKLNVFVLPGLFDQIIHSAENIDVVELFKHLHPKASNITVVP